MKVEFDPRSLEDLRWFGEYYESVFPEGKVRACLNFDHTLGLLSEFPEIGDLDLDTNTREFLIYKTKFTFIYRVEKQVIQIVRVWDTRNNPSLKPLKTN